MEVDTRMSEYKPPIELEEFTLERLKITLRKVIQKAFFDCEIDSNELGFHLREMVNEVYIHFYRDLATMKQDDKIYFQTPKTWWDHFKMEHRKNWLIKRLKPIQFGKHKYNVDKMLIFPDFKIPRGQEFKNYFKIIQARSVMK